MASPENQVATPQFAERGGFAERELLHVAVTRTGNAGGLQRDRYQPGAIDTKRGLTTPQVRRMQKFLGDSNEIQLSRLDRRQVGCWHVPAIGGARAALVLAS